MSRKTVKPARAARPAPLDAALRLAIDAHQRGQLAEAERRYRALLAVAPKHADALHFLGVLLHQNGQREGALALIARALVIAPGYVDARNNLGNVQKELGLAADAESSYRAVLAARPDFAPAWNNLGVVLKAQGRGQEAADAYRQALALTPDNAESWANLGNALRALHQLDEAMTAYHKAILLAPQSVDAYHNLGQALVSRGRTGEALDVYRRWQEQQPDNPMIAHMIAAVAGGVAPGRASDGYVQTTFDRFASSFDDVLASLDYRAPQLCGALVAEAADAPRGALEVLDAGCGTGLCAPILAPYAHALDGVDLSPKMLEKAAARGGYRRLEAAELTAWLADHPDSYDLVVSADTLCYFGALEDVVAAAAGAVRPGGHLVFTLEECSDDALPYRLNPHGRYSHGESYARACLAAAGLDVTALQRHVLRTELGAPVAGLAIAARRPPA
ncbi:tetratricopeptide repeat protein [Telluria beijingensis]|uniref:tetratricopeptide repeat protein n=1 Tax=Telluria beijingensis TaxID=3068633 RepID=UPI0027958152|nr:tetratricopeptide repeat protein [Massilia sp. REN29]